MWGIVGVLVAAAIVLAALLVPWWCKVFGTQKGGTALGWREQFETIAGGRRTVELTVRLSPADVLGALREHLVSAGPFGVTAETEGVLEVEDRSGAGGCMVWVVIGLVVALFTFGVGLVIVLLWTLAKFRRLRMEAAPSGSGATRLTISGYPQQAVTEAEQWIRANLPVEVAGG